MNETILKLQEAEHQAIVAKAYKLSTRKPGLVILLAVLMPLICYIYTGRYKPLGIFLLGMIVLAAVAIKGTDLPMWFLIAANVIAMLDNLKAVNNAKVFIAKHQ